MFPSLLYVGLAREHRSPFFDLKFDGGDCTTHAHLLLQEHRSCDQIEVWRDDARIAVVRRLKQDEPT